jgi:iron complex outermembrane receptor protein
MKNSALQALGLRTIVCAAALCACAPARAGSPGSSAAQLADLPLDALLDLPVSGASRYTQRQSQTAASVTVITADEIRAHGWRSLADVLGSVRGLMVTDDRVYSYLGVRGFYAPGDYSTRVLLLIDGNRTNDNVYDQAYLGTEFPLDLDLVERVEFIPGQGSSVYGANALFGIVNVVTRAAGEAGTRDASVRVGSGGLREWRLADSRRFEDGTTLMWSASRRLMNGVDVVLPLQAPPGSDGISRGTDYEQRSNLYFKGTHGAWTFTALHSERLKGVPTMVSDVFGDPRNSFRDEQSLMDLGWHAALDEHTELSARWFIGYYRYVGDYVVDYPPVTINQDFVTGQWWGAEARVLTRRWAGHTLMAGVELQDNTHERLANSDLDEAHTTYLDDSRSSRRTGLYVEDDIELGRQWHAIGGLRADHQRGVTEWSPRLALLWHLAEAWDAKLIYGRAFRPPNAYEAYYEVLGPAGYKLNPGLRNEQVRGLELALEGRLGSRTRVSASAYDNSAHQLLSLTNDPADGMYIFRNVGSLRSRGVEVEAEHFWDGGARLRGNLSLGTAQDGDSQLPLAAYAPRRMLKLLHSLPLPGRWTLGTEWQLRSPSGLAPGYGELNLALSTPLAARGWSASFSVFDLLNRRGTDPGSDPDVAHQPEIPHRGRWLQLQLDFAY